MMKLIALYIFDPQTPSFCLPVFEDIDCNLYVQAIDNDRKCIETFEPFVDYDQHRFILEDFKRQNIYKEVGDSIVACLRMSDNLYYFDSADSLKRIFLRDEILAALKGHPFMQMELVRFYDAKEMLENTAISCAEHLGKYSKRVALGWLVSSDLDRSIKAKIQDKVISETRLKSNSSRIVYKINRKLKFVIDKLASNITFNSSGDFIQNSIRIALNDKKWNDFVEKYGGDIYSMCLGDVAVEKISLSADGNLTANLRFEDEEYHEERKFSDAEDNSPGGVYYVSGLKVERISLVDDEFRGMMKYGEPRYRDQVMRTSIVVKYELYRQVNEFIVNSQAEMFNIRRAGFEISFGNLVAAAAIYSEEEAFATAFDGLAQR